MKNGFKFTTKSGWDGEVLEYSNCKNVKVLWQDGSVSTETSTDINRGSIKPKFQPLLVGEGYIGDGKFVDGRVNLLPGKIFDVELFNYWSRMIRRVYSEYELMKYPCYEKVEVETSWKNFQNFAEWADAHANSRNGWHLDKDLYSDLKIYSANTCTFLPEEVNAFLNGGAADKKSELPVGITLVRPRTSGAKEGYTVRINFNKVRHYFGYYDCPKEASLVYFREKHNFALKLIDKYRTVLLPKDIACLETKFKENR